MFTRKQRKTITVRWNTQISVAVVLILWISECRIITVYIIFLIEHTCNFSIIFETFLISNNIYVTWIYEQFSRTYAQVPFNLYAECSGKKSNNNRVQSFRLERVSNKMRTRITVQKCLKSFSLNFESVILYVLYRFFIALELITICHMRTRLKI